MQLNSLDWLDNSLAAAGSDVHAIAATLNQTTQQLYDNFTADADEEFLVRYKARCVDRVLSHCFRQFLSVDEQARNTLVAVGGYGRGELLPGSDIDLMLLLERRPTKAMQQKLSALITFLWDIGLEVGSSVRTIKDCVREGRHDVSIITNLIESRFIDGSHNLYDKFKAAIGPRKMWSSKQFFEAKLEEQKARHARFNDTAFKLEPNIKEGPGGLRDIQIIGWVGKRHYGAKTLEELVHDHGFLTADEYQTLIEGQTHLWRVRFALHRLTGRREDRLLFDYQRQLAESFGYQSADNNLAIEQFMQKYYRTIMELERLNEMLLQLLSQEILFKPFFNRKEKLNDDFILRNGYVEAVDSEVFVRNPSALIEIFVLMQSRKDIRGVAAATIRLIRQNLHLIDDEYRRDARNTELFMTYIRAPMGIIHQLRRMNRYGVLAAYIPVFEKIVGRMQYDLFHAYTVDQHTLFVIRNLRRFSVDEWRHELPQCNDIHDELEKPELLYLAGLFHDIAKGRGGDHSELGAQDAEEFCLDHGMNRKDTRVVSQLVRMHLLMSTTAQRKDISDPEVVHEFARVVGSESMLDYLYLLTIADMRGTNPELWNNWKQALLSELYASAKKILRHGIEQPPDVDEIISENREAACEMVAQANYDRSQIDAVCADFPGDYFLHHKAEQIVWHVSSIMGTQTPGSVVDIRQSIHSRSTEVFIYTRDISHVFSRVVGTLSSMNLDILYADIYTTSGGQTLDTFVIQDHTGAPISDDGDIDMIRINLCRVLESEEIPTFKISHELPRRLKSFKRPSSVEFNQDFLNHRTIMEVTSIDRPGLLYLIANVIADLDLQVSHAKIATLGEKVDDIFYLTDNNQEAVRDESMLERLRHSIIDTLDSDQPEALTVTEISI